MFSNFSKKDILWLQKIFLQIFDECTYPCFLTYEENIDSWQLTVDNIYRLQVCGLIECWAGKDNKLSDESVKQLCIDLSKLCPFPLTKADNKWWYIDICLSKKGENFYNRFFPNNEYEILNIEFIKELESIFNDYGVPFSKNPIFKILD